MVVWDITLCTTGAAYLKAGAGINKSTYYSGANADMNWGRAINAAESTVQAVTRKDWISIYSTLTSGAKLIIEDVVGSLAANTAIMHDLSLYPSRIVGEDMININRDTALRGMSILRDTKVQDWITGNA